MSSAIVLADLRSITHTDLPFLSALYASTRRKELAASGLPLIQQQIFLQSQFELQHQHYQKTFSDAEFKIIEFGNQPIGRIYYGWRNNHLHLIDIALLPEHQSKGIGRALMAQLMALTTSAKGKLLLHVDINNPVRTWYERLGFKPTQNNTSAANPFYQELVWDPII